MYCCSCSSLLILYQSIDLFSFFLCFLICIVLKWCSCAFDHEGGRSFLKELVAPRRSLKPRWSDGEKKLSAPKSFGWPSSDLTCADATNNVFQHRDLALISSPPPCAAVGTCYWTHAQCSSLFTLRTYWSLLARCCGRGTGKHVSERCRESLEATPFLFPPPPWCFISLTLTFAVPGLWFTHLWFVKLQHGCALKESGHVINHRKCQVLLLASSVRLLMRHS